MSAVDWAPGPLLRGMMDGGEDVRMRMLRPGVWCIDMTHRGRHGSTFVDSAIRETAQEAADNMERIIGGEG